MAWIQGISLDIAPNFRKSLRSGDEWYSWRLGHGESAKMWKQVEDGSVRNIWKCPECDEEAAISPDFYALSGTPMCQDCDCNMAYVRTEVRG